MGQNITLGELASRVRVDRQSSSDLFDAWLHVLLSAMDAEAPTIPFLEKVSVMKVPDLQDIIVSCDQAREYDDRTVAYELKHEALRRLVQEHRKVTVN